ncbi:circadian clock KaiB family protein [Neorhizobium petrolearium]|uniref:circadian clock KaiB family protein n=1 Tax=Neorhizobium petrolearium TaxID=515361 RepID=UPI003F17AFC6
MSIETPSGLAFRSALRLYVAGGTPGARRALESRKALIKAVAGEMDIEIIDILERPDLAEAAGILATPTLSDESVNPPRRMVGDISDTAQVLEFFGFRKKDAVP